MNKMKVFRIIAFLEGVSFLILLFIAMPMKYFMAQPLPVKITGMAHGVLFIAFVFYLLMVQSEYRWPVKKTILAFLASIVPFGTFVLDARVLKQETK